MDFNCLLARKDAIPQVITDAMEVAYLRRENYLWVDSLFTVPGNAVVKHYQISYMANIYSGAILTLAVVGVHDTKSNFPDVRPSTRWP